jgi:hypothetical protein
MPKMGGEINSVRGTMSGEDGWMGGWMGGPCLYYMRSTTLNTQAPLITSKEQTTQLRCQGIVSA